MTIFPRESARSARSCRAGQGVHRAAAIAQFDFNYKTATLLSWRVILPEAARQFTLPMLPADIELPAQADQTDVHVELVESSAFDYADMRSSAGTTRFRRDESLPAIRTLRSSSL